MSSHPARPATLPKDGAGAGRPSDYILDSTDDGRSTLMAIVDDFEEIATLLTGERGEAPVVEDQEIDPRQHLEEPRIAPVAAGKRQRFEQPWQPMVEDGAVAAACLHAGGILSSAWLDGHQVDSVGRQSIADQSKAQDGSFRRHHLQALVQRVEVGMDEIRIKGSKIQLLRELVASGGKRGVETSGPEVSIFVPKWLPGPDSNQRPTG